MAKKIKQIGTIIIVLIVIGAVFAMAFVGSTAVESIKKVSVISQNDNGAIVSWKSAKNLDGYNVYYCKNTEIPEWKCKQIVGEKSNYIEFNDLDYCTDYKFYVLGVKYFNGKVYESDDYKEAELFVLPKKQEIKSCYSHNEGIASLKWNIDPSVTGYQISYSLNEDMSSAKVVEVADSAVNNYDFEELEVDTNYYFTVNSYYLNNSKRVDGPVSDVESVTIASEDLITTDIDPNKPMVALTFDDGPNPLSTKIVLDVLEQYSARATFFMIADNANDANGVRENADYVKKMVELNCEIGNHTYDHERLGSDVRPEDIYNCSQAIYEITGNYPTAFRSTGGRTTQVIRDECAKEGMPLYYWSLDTEDWKPKNRNSDYVYHAVVDNIKDGDIVLMHDIRMTTAEAVQWIVPELINQGYQLVTVSELVTAKTGEPPVAGEQYLNGSEIKNDTK